MFAYVGGLEFYSLWLANGFRAPRMLFARSVRRSSSSVFELDAQLKCSMNAEAQS